MKHNAVMGWAVAVALVVAVSGCSNQQETAPAAGGVTAELLPPANDAPIPPTPSPYDVLPDSVQAALDKPFMGDFDEMVKRRVIRVGVTFNRTHYFIDKGQERGITYEALKAFENDLNTELKTGNLKLHVVIMPLSRDLLYQ